MYHCKTCGYDWPENYCPECHSTIDKGSEWFDSHAQTGQKKEIAPNPSVNPSSDLKPISEAEAHELLKTINKFGVQAKWVGSKTKNTDSKKATVAGSLLQIGLGLLLTAGGVWLTWATYTIAASGGGTYFIFWGLAIWGMVVVFKGFGNLFVASWKIGIFAAVIFLVLIGYGYKMYCDGAMNGKW